jgi:hypothetical protein
MEYRSRIWRHNSPEPYSSSAVITITVEIEFDRRCRNTSSWPLARRPAGDAARRGHRRPAHRPAASARDKRAPARRVFTLCSDGCRRLGATILRGSDRPVGGPSAHRPWQAGDHLKGAGRHECDATGDELPARRTWRSQPGRPSCLRRFVVILRSRQREDHGRHGLHPGRCEDLPCEPGTPAVAPGGGVAVSFYSCRLQNSSAKVTPPHKAGQTKWRST